MLLADVSKPCLESASIVPSAAARNPYPFHFRNMYDMVCGSDRREGSALESGPIHVLRFAGGQDRDPRTYSAPSSAEISCAIVGEGCLPKHFISVYERSDDASYGTTHELSPLSEHVDPLTYPLIHVDGLCVLLRKILVKRHANSALLAPISCMLGSSLATPMCARSLFTVKWY